MRLNSIYTYPINGFPLHSIQSKSIILEKGIISIRSTSSVPCPSPSANIVSFLYPYSMNNLIHTKRGTFNVRLYGNPTYQPFIVLHSWPQTSYCWHHATAFLKDFYVIAPDLRGMGDSNRDLDIKKYAKDEMAADIYRMVPKDRARWAKNYLGKNITIPTCIIHGILDPVIIKEYIEGVEECFSNIQVQRLKGEHFILDERPEEVGNAMTTFLLAD